MHIQYAIYSKLIQAYIHTYIISLYRVTGPTNKNQSAILKVLFQNDRLIQDNVVGLKLAAVVGRVDYLLLLLAFAETAH